MCVRIHAYMYKCANVHTCLHTYTCTYPVCVARWTYLESNKDGHEKCPKSCNGKLYFSSYAPTPFNNAYEYWVVFCKM